MGGRKNGIHQKSQTQAEVLQPLPQGHIQERVAEPAVDFHVPPIKEAIAEVLQHMPQEFNLEHIAHERMLLTVEQNIAVQGLQMWENVVR